MVAGIGNRYRRDDGAGLHVTDQLVSDLGGDVRDVGPVVDPLDLLGRWDGAALAVVVDAVRSDRAPGTVSVVELDHDVTSRRRTGHAPASTHGIDVAGALRIAHVLGRAPRRVVLVGITGADFGQGPGLSPAVEAAIPEAVNAVRQLVGRSGPCASAVST
ncbi:MAG TPA: hydrogenase maturation protease [Acidimicrobiales bacterium]|nr:hydrogenase maturation protease [Acidimicrobiales bacterium]